MGVRFGKFQLNFENNKDSGVNKNNKYLMMMREGDYCENNKHTPIKIFKEFWLIIGI